MDKYSFNVTDLLRRANTALKNQDSTIKVDPIPSIQVYISDDA